MESRNRNKEAKDMRTKQDRDSWLDALPDLASRKACEAKIKERVGDEVDDVTEHSWRSHEVFIIEKVCEANGLEASFFDTDTYDPVATFEREDCDGAIASVARSGGRYHVLDFEGKLIKEGSYLLDLLIETIHKQTITIANGKPGET